MVNLCYLQLAMLIVKDKKRNGFAAEVKGGSYDLQNVSLSIGINTEIGLNNNYSFR